MSATVTERPVLTRSFEVEIHEIEGRNIEGCCVPYGNPARVSDGGAPYHEVFEPGCFRKQVKAAQRLELRYEHRDGLADSIGLCRSLHDESSGLFGTFRVHEGAFGDQALELVRAGVLPGFSISFSDRFTHWSRTDEGTVVRQNCILHEVSLVRSPAYEGAVVTGVRSRESLLGDLALPELDDEQLARLRAIGITV